MKKIFCLLALGLACAVPVIAQLPGTGQNGMNAALLKLLEDLQAFTARTDVSYEEKGSKPVTMPMGFALLDGKLRLDIDLSLMKSAQLQTQVVASLKLAKLDKAVTIIRPDRDQAVLIYPGAASYVAMPMAKEEAEDWKRSYRVERKKLGRDTIDGKACEKQRVTLTGDNNVKHEATIWYSLDARPVPVKLQMSQPGANVTMQFRNVSLERPDASLFEVGPGLTQYRTVEQLAQAALAKALGAK